MTEDMDSLARATARSIVARQQLANTMVDLQSRLSPQRLMREGVQELRETAGELGRDTLDHVRANPGQVAGLVGALIIFFARDRIADSVSKLAQRSVKPRRRRRVDPAPKIIPRKDRP